MMQAPTGTAVSLKALQKELRHIQEEGVEGFTVKLVDERNLFEWEVVIFGPPQTLYEGGYFKLLMKFPVDYPYSPPSVRFLTKLWHPNVYENGDLCISILHPPVDDPQSGELPSERWNPTQNVRTVLLSVISLLNEPNTFSPANVDASVMYRKWKETKGENKEYEEYVRKLVADTQVEAARDNVRVPTTIEEYVATRRGHGSGGNSGHASADGPDVADFYDDDFDGFDEDDDDEDEVEPVDNGGGDVEETVEGSDDSGNGES